MSGGEEEHGEVVFRSGRRRQRDRERDRDGREQEADPVVCFFFEGKVFKVFVDFESLGHALGGIRRRIRQRSLSIGRFQ